MRSRVGLTALLLSATGCALLSGCSLFIVGKSEESSGASLPRLVAPRDSIQLEILFVDRPASDPLIGDALWERVDQIAGIASGERNRLRDLGWRVGQSTSSPPKALQELFKAAGERPEAMDGDRRVTGRRIAVPAGDEVPIELTDLLPRMEVVLKGAEKRYSNVKAVLRVHVDREQDGWVKLRFVPEIHHGQNLLRPFATATDWSRRRSRNVMPLYDQQFSLSLNVGELALVTAMPDNGEDSQVPAAFFRSLDEAGQLQRLLVIRVANMRRLKPTFENSRSAGVL